MGFFQEHLRFFLPCPCPFPNSSPWFSSTSRSRFPNYRAFLFLSPSSSSARLLTPTIRKWHFKHRELAQSNRLSDWIAQPRTSIKDMETNYLPFDNKQNEWILDLGLSYALRTNRILPDKRQIIYRYRASVIPLMKI